MIRTFGNVTGITNQPQGLDVGLVGASAPWINDWSAYTTTYDWSGTTVSVPATSWGTFLNITGEGWLTFVQGFSSGTVVIPDVRITIDGTSYLFLGQNSASAYNGNIISKPIYFKTSLKIEAYNLTGSATGIGCDYSYLLKSGTPDTTKQSILRASSRNTAFNQVASATPTNIVSVSGAGYLLGVEFSGFYGTTSGSVVATVIIDGVTKMNARQVFLNYYQDNKFHHFEGPIRFTSSLTVQHNSGGTTTNAISKASYTLD